MTEVFFSGYGEWFIEDNKGETYPHSNLVSYIKYDDYEGKYYQIDPTDEAITGNFLLTNDDATRCRKKIEKYNSPENELTKLNFNFVTKLLTLPANNPGHEKIKPPKPDLNCGEKYIFKVIKKTRPNPNGGTDDYNIIDPIIERDQSLIGDLKKNKALASSIKYKTIDPRSETTYLHTIAALYAFIVGDFPEVDKHPSFENQSQLIDKIDQYYSEYNGLKERTLYNTIPKAIKKLKDG